MSYATLAGVKARLKITDATDDAVLDPIVKAADAWVMGRVGLDIGPSSDTMRVYDGDGTDTLFVPGGIRSAPSLVETRASTGDSWTTLTATILLRPKAWEVPPGSPHTSLVLASGTWPCGPDTVRVTSSAFGWSAPPPDLVDVAETLAVRAWNARLTGQRDVLGSDALGNPMVSRFVSTRDLDTCDRYRWANSDFGYV
ncbi:MAG: phage gp6-like head-tail connector protein [Chloroflexi bacterium]|nr:phage gp6-like head-tail connector protein [Chloroflexota bacterium]